MTSAEATPLLVRELLIEARPEIVFRFLTERELILRWQGIDAALDVRPDGEFRIVLHSGDTVAGRFLEVDPPRRLVYTWGWQDGGVPGIGAGSTRVDITLEAVGAATRLRLTHSGLPADRDVASSHGDGWSYYLMRLADIVEGRTAEAGATDMSTVAGAIARFDARFGTRVPRA